jgi:branched-chain amino acid transport system ATP-binding protein
MPRQLLPSHFGWHPLLAMAAGAAAAGLLAGIVARPIFKLKGHYLAMATLGLGIIINIVVRTEAAWTGGPDGMPVPAMSLGGFEISGDKHWYWIVALLLSVSVWASLNLIDSPFGRALRALHGSEVASKVVGVDVVRYKVAIFVMSAVFASIMGSVTAHYVGFVTPNLADFFHSIELVTMVVIGGMASVYGSVVGAVLLTALPQALASFEGWETVAFGAIFDAVHDFSAQGAGAHVGRQVRQRGMSMALLEVKDLSIHFGGVKAVQNVTFSIDAGIVYAVIGPNGAGKTTLFNLITGIYTPTTGSIMLDGESIGGKSPDELARRGVARTFQNLQICMNMSAIENVMVVAHLRLDRNLIKAALRWPSLRKRDRELHAEATELMRFVGLDAFVNARADAMPYGALKRLEIARALAMKPRLIFLDEPAAGLNPKETIEVDELVRKVADSGVTVVLVEHDMKMVMNLSDRILVLDYGKKLTEGTGAEVRRNPDVIAAYLGAHA